MGYTDGAGTAIAAPFQAIDVEAIDHMENPTDNRTTPAPYAWRVLHRNDRPPAVGGVYAIYIDDALAYIGQSQNIQARLRSYRIRPQYGAGYFTPWGKCERVVIKIKVGRRYGEWAMREQRLIRRLMPTHNKALA